MDEFPNTEENIFYRIPKVECNRLHTFPSLTPITTQNCAYKLDEFEDGLTDIDYCVDKRPEGLNNACDNARHHAVKGHYNACNKVKYRLQGFVKCHKRIPQGHKQFFDVFPYRTKIAKELDHRIEYDIKTAFCYVPYCRKYRYNLGHYCVPVFVPERTNSGNCIDNDILYDRPYFFRKFADFFKYFLYNRPQFLEQSGGGFYDFFAVFIPPFFNCLYGFQNDGFYLFPYLYNRTTELLVVVPKVGYNTNHGGYNRNNKSYL